MTLAPASTLVRAPELVHVADFCVLVGTPLVVGETTAGLRRVVPILGGTAVGRIAGRIEAGGADFQLLRRDDATELEARYTIVTASGARVYVVNQGLRHGPKVAMEALARGEAVDPALVYFRSVPRFETDAPELEWLTYRLFVASGVRRPDRVELSVFEIG